MCKVRNPEQEGWGDTWEHSDCGRQKEQEEMNELVRKWFEEREVLKNQVEELKEEVKTSRVR